MELSALGWGWGLREGFMKKIAVLLDFVQMRGGGSCPNFLSTFHKLYIESILGWRGRGRPLPKFFGTLAIKKVVKVVQIRGRGGGVEVI